MMQQRLWNFDTPLTDTDVLGVFGSVGEGMTRLDVARKLRRAKSPTLVTRLNKLAYEGFLRAELVTLPNLVDMYVYYLTEKGEAELRQSIDDKSQLLFTRS